MWTTNLESRYRHYVMGMFEEVADGAQQIKFVCDFGVVIDGEAEIKWCLDVSLARSFGVVSDMANDRNMLRKIRLRYSLPNALKVFKVELVERVVGECFVKT